MMNISLNPETIACLIANGKCRTVFYSEYDHELNDSLFVLMLKNNVVTAVSSDLVVRITHVFELSPILYGYKWTVELEVV